MSQLATPAMKPAEAKAEPSRGVVRLALPIALAAIFAAQCAWFINTQSLTADEPSHIISGLNGWHEASSRSTTIILRCRGCCMRCRFAAMSGESRR